MTIWQTTTKHNNEDRKFSKCQQQSKPIGWLVEVVARFIGSIPLLTNFTNIVAQGAVGWYFLVTAAIIIVWSLSKAFKE
jgi:hypothetical protein